MFNSNSSSRGGFLRRSRFQHVSVIDTRVHSASASRAKLAFWLTLVAAGLIGAAVLTSNMHPLAAVLLGALIGVPVACCVWVAVRVWPVVQRVWWWAPELVLLYVTVRLVSTLANLAGGYLALAVVAVLVGLPAAIGPVRRPVWALVWCQVIRHRLRMAFSDFIRTNQHGTLPLILWARPVPAGVQVWVFLRPGLSKADVDTWLDKLASACWSDEVRTERASVSNAAFLRIDVKRRDVLRRRVTNPLMQHVDPATPTVPRQLGVAPTALDLADIDESFLSTHLFKPDSAKRPRRNSGSANGDTASTKPYGWGDPDLEGWG